MTPEKKSAFVYGDRQSCEEICLALARDGYAVGFTHSPSDGDAARELARSVESLGGRAVACPAETPSAEELSRSVVACAEAFGGISALVFARRGQELPGGALLLDLDESDWDAAACEAKTFFLLCKYALPYLINEDGARLMVLDRFDEGAPIPGLVFGHALETAARSVAAELAWYGVSVLYKNMREDETISGVLASYGARQ